MSDDSAPLAQRLETYLSQGPDLRSGDLDRNEFADLVSDLTRLHVDKCIPYRNIVSRLFPTREGIGVSNEPFIPVRLFKTLNLRSIDAVDIAKTMTSSGTTGQEVSRIFLDNTTARLQTRALAQIMSSLLGSQRLPMLVIDSSQAVANRTSFTARGAGIRGFSMFGRDVTYALRDDLTLDHEAIALFLDKHRDSQVFLFGFTYIIWQNFIRELEKQGKTLGFRNGLLLHGGGWKKLIDLSVSNESFSARAAETLGVSRVANYYGMVEQTGSIFLECEQGFFHTSAYGDVLIRDFKTLREVNDGEPGFIQLISILPVSYPGHSILSEDIGTVIGRGDCACGRYGKRFVVHGRVQNAEVRGCSDTQP